MAQTTIMNGIDERKPNLILPEPGFEAQYCRLCRSYATSQFKQLFSPFNTTKMIVEVIEDFAKISISQEDAYSKLICFNCFMKLTESENFKYLIVNSDFKLKCMIADNTEDIVEEKIDIDEIDLKKELVYRELEEENLVEENIENQIEEDSLKVKKKCYRKFYTLKCSVCEKSFHRRDTLAVHMVTHTRNYPFHCSICKKGFAKKCRLKLHEMDHTGARNYQCEICGKSFKTHALLICHRKTHEGLTPFKCDQCNRAFRTKRSLEMHLANIHSINTEGSTFRCTVCNKEYKTAYLLQKHTRQTHNPLEVGLCNICGKVRRRLTAHKRAHFKRNKCKECSKTFGTSKELKNHLVVHTGE